jgi:hypothetical protein
MSENFHQPYHCYLMSMDLQFSARGPHLLSTHAEKLRAGRKLAQCVNQLRAIAVPGCLTGRE